MHILAENVKTTICAFLAHMPFAWQFGKILKPPWVAIEALEPTLVVVQDTEKNCEHSGFEFLYFLPLVSVLARFLDESYRFKHV